VLPRLKVRTNAHIHEAVNCHLVKACDCNVHVQVHKEGTRDPGRLLRPTSAHQRRVELTQAEEHATKDSGFILTTSHKAAGHPLCKAAAGY